MTSNQLKYLLSLHQKKNRYSERLFLSEGEHLAEEVLKSKIYKSLIRKIFHTPDFKNEKLLGQIYKNKIEVEVIPGKTLERIAESETPQGIVALIEMPAELDIALTPPVLALDSINDPGNLGTIIRTAYWFGIPNLIISENSADIYNSKVLRSTQGAIYHVSVSFTKNLHEKLKTLSDSGCGVYVADLKSGNNLGGFKFTLQPVFVFGNESHGVSNAISSDNSFTSFRIKPYSGCESLNVASAVAITLYEYRKSRI